MKTLSEFCRVAAFAAVAISTSQAQITRLAVVGQTVRVKEGGGYREGRVVRTDQHGVLVMFPMYDGRWDEKNGPTRYYQAAELLPKDASPPSLPGASPRTPDDSLSSRPIRTKAPTAPAGQGTPRAGTYEIVTVNLTSGVVTGRLVLKENGVYEVWEPGATAPRSTGHYRYDAAQQRVFWLDGLNYDLGRGGSFSVEGNAHRIMLGTKTYAISK